MLQMILTHFPDLFHLIDTKLLHQVDVADEDQRTLVAVGVVSFKILQHNNFL